MTEITPALEDYLETILMIQEEKKIARVKDLVERHEVKAPSVNEAIRNLKDKDLIAHESYGHIEFTKKGLALAKKIYGRHKLLKEFLRKVLGVQDSTAEEDACKIEHYLSQETMTKMTKYIEEGYRNGTFKLSS